MLSGQIINKSLEKYTKQNPADSKIRSTVTSKTDLISRRSAITRSGLSVTFVVTELERPEDFYLTPKTGTRKGDNIDKSNVEIWNWCKDLETRVSDLSWNIFDNGVG